MDLVTKIYRLKKCIIYFLVLRSYHLQTVTIFLLNNIVFTILYVTVKEKKKVFDKQPNGVRRTETSKAWQQIIWCESCQISTSADGTAANIVREREQRTTPSVKTDTKRPNSTLNSS